MKKAKEVNEKYMKEIYLNILKAVIIVTYFFVLNLSYENVRSEYLDIAIKVFTMAFLFIAIVIFEKAYKKDDGNLAMQGIEVLLLATYTLTTEHITNKFHFNFKSYSLVASYLFATYFILKSIITYTKGRKELVEERSDIREIVKKDEPTPISTKKKSTEETTEVKKTTKKKSTEKTTQKKKTTVENSKSNTETKKTRTTPTKKKTAVSKSDDTKAEDKKVEQEEKPKRKRVKKEVTEND